MIIVECRAANGSDLVATRERVDTLAIRELIVRIDAFDDTTPCRTPS